MACWNRQTIRHRELCAQVRRTEGSLADRMLVEWVRANLLPKPTRSAVPVEEPGEEGEVKVGTVLRAGAPADRFLLSDQFLHKSLLLVVHEIPAGLKVVVVLNRPTINLVKFRSDGDPCRCIRWSSLPPVD